MSSDVIISIWNPHASLSKENRDKSSGLDLLLNLMKNRQGQMHTEKTRDIAIEVNWKVRYMGSMKDRIYSGMGSFDQDLPLDSPAIEIEGDFE